MPSFFIKYKKYIGISLAAVAVIVIYFIMTNDTYSDSTTEIDPPNQLEKIADSPDSAQTKSPPQANKLLSTSVIVDLKGAIKKPGVYELDENARVIDAIEEAGGYRDNADQLAINQAEKLQDEMIIYVPKKGEKLPEQVQTKSAANPTQADPAAADTPQVNINTADATELQTLNGVGPSKAQAIIDHRTNVGLFETPEDLKKVAGIGDKTFEKLQPSIIVK